MKIFFFILAVFVTNSLTAQTPVTKDSVHLKHSGIQLFAQWSPDSRFLVYQSNEKGNWDIFLYDSQTGNSRPLTVDSLDEQHPVWVPGKQAVVFEVGTGHQSRLYKLDLQTGKKKILIGRNLASREASFTPSRHLVAFSGWDPISNSWQIFTYDFVYDNLNQLTLHAGNASFPVFTPDGRKIAYTLKSFDVKSSLHLMNWYGENDKAIADSGSGRISWTPSSWRFFSVQGNSVNGFDLCSFRNDGSEMKCFFHSPAQLCCPELSPNCTKIVFSEKTEKGFDIFFIKMPVN